jgi:hypothetical protein
MWWLEGQVEGTDTSAGLLRTPMSCACARSCLRTGLHLADWTPRADLHRQHQLACQPLSREQRKLGVLFYAGALSLLLAPAVADRSISLRSSTRRLGEKARQIRTSYSKITWVKGNKHVITGDCQRKTPVEAAVGHASDSPGFSSPLLLPRRADRGELFSCLVCSARLVAAFT